MGRFLVLWRMNEDFIPGDINDRQRIIEQISKITREDIKRGVIKDWGISIDGKSGYSVRDEPHADFLKHSMLMAPYIETQEIMNVVGFEESGKVIEDIFRTKMEMARVTKKPVNVRVLK
jgi:hypothetical protein